MSTDRLLHDLTMHPVTVDSRSKTKAVIFRTIWNLMTKIMGVPSPERHISP